MEAEIATQIYNGLLIDTRISDECRGWLCSIASDWPEVDWKPRIYYDYRSTEKVFKLIAEAEKTRVSEARGRGRKLGTQCSNEGATSKNK